jgi:hypothetical protein
MLERVFTGRKYHLLKRLCNKMRKPTMGTSITNSKGVLFVEGIFKEEYIPLRRI